MADRPQHILVCATQAAPSRLTLLLREQFGAGAVTQLQTVQLQATGDCVALAAALLKPFNEPAPAAPANHGTRIEHPAWVVLTSPGGIGVVWQELRARGLTQAHLKLLKYAVVGDATADALREEGLEPAYISGHGSHLGPASGRTAVEQGSEGKPEPGGPMGSSAKGGGAGALAEGLAASGLTAGAVVHVLQSNRADSSVWAPLQAKAAVLKRWVAYRSDLMPAAEREHSVVKAFNAGQFTAAAFTSGSTVEGLYAVLGMEKAADTTAGLKKMKVFSIGPTATRTVQGYGVLQVFDAAEATVNSLAEAVRKTLK